MYARERENRKTEERRGENNGRLTAETTAGKREKSALFARRSKSIDGCFKIFSRLQVQSRKNLSDEIHVGVQLLGSGIGGSTSRRQQFDVVGILS